MSMNLTILGQAIAFILFVWFCMKFVWPPITSAIEKRQKDIAEGLSSAELAKKELKLAKANTEELMQQAKAEAFAIIEKANKHKVAILKKAKQEAICEKEKVIEQGFAELEAQYKRAKNELKKQIANLAIAGAEKIIEHSVDKAVNSELVDKLVLKLGREGKCQN